MIELKDLLLRFNNLLLSEEVKTETIRNIISENINLEIKREDITIKNNIIYLDIKPIYKSEILLKEEKIFSALKEAFGGRAPSSIR